MAKRPHCWLGRHAWVKRESTEGDVYGECTHCGKRDWVSTDFGTSLWADS
jgi:hypothetical protein